jgi:hypothetical protein
MVRDRIFARRSHWEHILAKRWFVADESKKDARQTFKLA